MASEGGTKRLALVGILFSLCATKCLICDSPARAQGAIQKLMPLNILHGELVCSKQM